MIVMCEHPTRFVATEFGPVPNLYSLITEVHWTCEVHSKSILLSVTMRSSKLYITLTSSTLNVHYRSYYDLQSQNEFVFQVSQNLQQEEWVKDGISIEGGQEVRLHPRTDGKYSEDTEDILKLSLRWGWNESELCSRTIPDISPPSTAQLAEQLQLRLELTG